MIDFDQEKDTIQDDQKGRMETKAQYLKAAPAAVVTLEGNGDRRGTHAYKVALGHRKNNSAEKYLVKRGVNVNTISSDERKPLNIGHDELAWPSNRCDHLAQR